MSPRAVHDFDPTTGKTTMVLVETSIHEANLPHSGSVKQYEKMFGVKYETYDAKIISYDNGWRKRKSRKNGEKNEKEKEKQNDCKN